MTLSKIAQNGASTNDILKWDGTNWVVASDNDTLYTAGTNISIDSGEISADIPLNTWTTAVITDSEIRGESEDVAVTGALRYKVLDGNHVFFELNAEYGGSGDWNSANRGETPLCCRW